MVFSILTPPYEPSWIKSGMENGLLHDGFFSFAVVRQILHLFLR